MLQAAPRAKGKLGVLPDSSPAPWGLVLHTFTITVMTCSHIRGFRVRLWWSHHESIFHF